MNGLISVIIPAHNSEKTLVKCCDSILNNTYRELELLIIENNSIDDTYEIAKSIAMNDYRVKVIRTSEKGVSNARNIGLRNATGDFVSFVDADDTVDINYISVLVSILNNANVDLVQCEHCFSYKDNASNDLDYSFISMESSIKNFLLGNINGYVWGKLYKRHIIIENKIEFCAELSIGEDRRFVFQYLSKSGSIANLNCDLYYYSQNDSSVLNGGFGANRFNLVEESIYEYNCIVCYGDDELRSIATENMIREHIRYLIMATKNNIIQEEQYKCIRRLVRGKLLTIIRMQMTSSWKIYAVLSSILPMIIFVKMCGRKNEKKKSRNTYYTI